VRIRDVFTGYHVATGSRKAFFAKSAMISFMVPKIVELFPDAGFLHLYRYGPSVLASYVQKNFRKYTRFVYTERDYRLQCARYWNDCILELEARKHDQDLSLGGRFLEMSYEDLCRSPTDALRPVATWLGISPDGFTFDFGQVASRNYKVADHTGEPGWDELLEAMAPAMSLKGYPVSAAASPG
jgi:hypothetical protein